MGGLRPIRLDGESDNQGTPEALLITAFLNTGSFDLDRYHVDSDMIASWRKVWDFCIDYQAKEGVAPPVSLVLDRFPDFEMSHDVGCTWASSEVIDAHAIRTARVLTGTAAAALEDKDLKVFYETISQVTPPRTFTKEALSAFDHALLEERFDMGHYEVPWPTLTRATSGGIADSELWYVAARFSNGKTFTLARMAARVADTAPVRIGFASFEMPAAQIGERILAGLCGSDSGLFAQLTGDDIGGRKAAQDILMAKTLGSVKIYDPSHLAINTIEHVRDMCADYDLVFLDHVGLMKSRGGKRAIEDWRVMAEISNQLRELTLSSGTSVIAAAQINRAGENEHTAYPPKAKDLAQSDALGQDADVIITQKKRSRRLLSMGAEKVRNGPTAHWFARFDPKRNRFNEVDKETADAQVELDGDF
jgi:DnaB-like helicase C terminal domain